MPLDEREANISVSLVGPALHRRRLSGPARIDPPPLRHDEAAPHRLEGRSHGASHSTAVRLRRARVRLPARRGQGFVRPCSSKHAQLIRPGFENELCLELSRDVAPDADLLLARPRRRSARSIPRSRSLSRRAATSSARSRWRSPTTPSNSPSCSGRLSQPPERRATPVEARGACALERGRRSARGPGSSSPGAWLSLQLGRLAREEARGFRRKASRRRLHHDGLFHAPIPAGGRRSR